MTNEAGLEFEHLGEAAVPVDARLIAHEGGVQLYQAPEGAKITATTEHGGYLFVALQHGSGKDEIVMFNLNETSPAVPVIEGLDEAINAIPNYKAYYQFDTGMETICEASRAYAALPKMQKVDLDGMKRQVCGYGYNQAIDDLKSKYGELYYQPANKE